MSLTSGWDKNLHEKLAWPDSAAPASGGCGATGPAEHCARGSARLSGPCSPAAKEELGNKATDNDKCNLVRAPVYQQEDVRGGCSLLSEARSYRLHWGSKAAEPSSERWCLLRAYLRPGLLHVKLQQGQGKWHLSGRENQKLFLLF